MSAIMDVFVDNIDHRTDKYVLMTSFWTPVTITATYFLLVLKILPKFMEKRNPYDLRKILIVYNAVQVILNALIVLYGLRSFVIHSNLLCCLVDYTESYDGNRELFACYCYYLTKVMDLMDTVFFVLKKNYRQVTHLHLYHHASMVIGTWIVVRYFGGGHTLWMGFFNCIVHVFMYSYYLLSAYKPSFKENMTLKRSVTSLQLFQFVCCLFLYTVAFIRPSCRYPKAVAFIMIPQNAYFLYLFSKFYHKTYLSKPSKNEKVQSNGNVPNVNTKVSNETNETSNGKAHSE